MGDLMGKMFRELSDDVMGVYTPFQEQYRNDPVGFAKDVLGVALWSSQEDILTSVQTNKYTAASAALATGKTYSAACIALWFLNTRPYSKVIVTAAPPERQIRDLLFAEIRALQKSCLTRGVPLVGGEPQTLRLTVADNWWMQGFTIPMTGTPEERMSKFHGHHAAGGVLVLADEAHGIPPEIFEAFDNVTSAAACRVLLISNPLAPTGPFWAATRDEDYNTITVSAFDHPNVMYDETRIPGAIDRETTARRIRKFTRPVTPADRQAGSAVKFVTIPWTGEERVVTNPVFFYKVLGVFPDQAQGALIPMIRYQLARQRYDVLVEEARLEGFDVPPDLPLPVCGLDIAEFGSDANTFIARFEHFVTPPIRWYGLNPVDSARRGARLARLVDAARVNVEAIGVGAGVPKLMREEGVNAVGVKVSWSPTRAAREYEFYQLRDQLGWEVREWFHRNDAAVGPDEELEADLFAFKYDVLRKGTRISPKKAVRKRLMGRSPDGFDSLCMTFYEGLSRGRGTEGVRTMMMGRRRGGSRRPQGPRGQRRPRAW